MALYSRTRAAINTGYGHPIHPEYYFGGPYGNPRHRTGGKALLKRCRGGGYNTAALDGYGYNTAALDGYGYNTAALDGYGYNTAALDGYGYNTAALDGYGETYNNAALYGYGMEEVLTSMAKAVGPTAMKVLERLAQQFSTTVINLVKDPEKLVSLLNDYAPKIAGIVKKFFNWLKNKSEQVRPVVEQVKDTAKKVNDVATNVMGEAPKDTLTRYMQWLKQQDPVAYQTIYRQMQKVKWAQQNLQRERMFKV